MERSIDELIELLNDKDDFVVEDAVGELELMTLLLKMLLEN